jgi:hypothetical protein
MNPDSELFKKLVKDAGIQLVHWDDSPRLYIENMTYDGNLAKFAELIVRECVNECKQEWYDLNAESVADDDPFLDPRATGIRVGQKNGILKCISKIKQHFGVEE